MKRIIETTALAALASLTLTAEADAATIVVSGDISTSTTWTADNVYDLGSETHYVLPGASLTIEAGTIIATTTGAGGSLAVAKGGQIFVKGTNDEPVIMTSTDDVATWDVDASHPTGRDPASGDYRLALNEWGNLTLMGAGYISENEAPTGLTNSATPSASNVADMEGLEIQVGSETLVQYGGGNDDDDSGCINFLSIRYGGKVAALNKELNGLSLGGIGRETDIHHVEIMNNVDDGIEIWGGAVNLKYLSIWNIGDDSLDIDQGYRGKIQFGLIVQGMSDSSVDQGSGVGDNAIETDGAEDSDWQPVTTTEIRNVTVIGQPLVGDGGTAWRDNARVRYENCVWMDLGDQLVRFDNDDGDGASGYGHNGTLSWADTWTTPFTATSAVNPFGSPAEIAAAYTAQTQGNLADIESSVFFRNLAGGGLGAQGDPAYAEAVARGVFDASNDNILTAGFLDADAPVKLLTRGAVVVTPDGPVAQVTKLNPCPANDALVPGDSHGITDPFFTAAPFRGGFPENDNWLTGWTAASAFGLSDDSDAGSWNDLGCALPAVSGSVNSYPVLEGFGATTPGNPVTLNLRNARGGAICGLFLGIGIPGSSISAPFKGGVLKTFLPIASPFILSTLPDGTVPLPFNWFAGASGLELIFQYGISDPDALIGVSISNAISTID